MTNNEKFINTIVQGDVREVAKILPDNFVNTIVTSPPYWGLRDYGTGEWEGGDENCDHQIGRFEYPASVKQKSNSGSAGPDAQHCCPKCGAIRTDNQIGQESTPTEYVETLVSVFRELRRVLRDDGTLWLNLGDSYATSPPGNKEWKSKGEGANKAYNDGIFGLLNKVTSDCKPKDLIGIPWRVALALQQDGWWLRSDIIWHKPAPMPESVTDRPTKSHEYIFLLTKNSKYYYDQDVIREKNADTYFGKRGTTETRKKMQSAMKDKSSRETMNRYSTEGRNKRSVWTVNTASYSDAHFAVFPPELITPCVLAGCPPDGIVLDPFIGSGTVAEVAIANGRNWLGVDLSPVYVEMANRRIAKTNPALFALGGIQ